MSLSVDTSALLKLYVEEGESASCEALLEADPSWVTARHTYVEVHRNLARILPEAVQPAALEEFLVDWQGMRIVELTPLMIVTYDQRQAEAAHAMGLEVITP